MLRLDLAQLEREGSLRIQAEVPADSPAFAGLEFSLGGALEVDLRASTTVTGEIVVRGTVRGPLRQECRRCLEPVEGQVDEEVTLVFAYDEELTEGGGGEIRLLDATRGEMDLEAVIREELMLSVSAFAICSPACKGFCPRCGTNLNELSCDCGQEELDPRWDTLRALEKD